jgi:hypothetical protein
MNLNDKLKCIGHSLSNFCELECWASQRQAEGVLAKQIVVGRSHVTAKPMVKLKLAFLS